MKLLLVSPLPPDEQPDDTCRIEGVEPWQIAALAAHFPKPAVSAAVIESADVLRISGPAALSPEHRASMNGSKQPWWQTQKMRAWRSSKVVIVRCCN